uniref:C2H2-type domain-containing protein n=1 Tax=Dracunculus medinensis TaxID=318479 RepID=A0A0N4UEF0_DRAME
LRSKKIFSARKTEIFGNILFFSVMNIFSPAQTLGKYPCKKCDRRDFDTIRELSEHEIRAHGAVIPCPHCSRDRSSVQKLVDHLQRRHGTSRLVCHYCKESFSSRIETAKSSIIDDYRAHIYKECLKEKMYKHERLTGRSGAIAQRGRGRCPHGPPVKCKNFPSCPGDKCYYFHGFCRHDLNCTKKDCPFDHTNRPRTCLSCLRDLRVCFCLLYY